MGFRLPVHAMDANERGLRAWGHFMFHREQPLIFPRKRKKDPRIGPVAVMVAIEKDLALVRQALDVREKATGRILTSKVFVGTDRRNNMAVVGPILGAPHAVMVLEKLVVLGAKKILFMGWCGSIQETVAIGDLLIPDRGLIGEGTSRYYASVNLLTESKSSPGIVETTKKTCVRHGMSFHLGAVWSTDAPYRETAKQLLSLKKQDVLGVDMESSALFTVGRFRQVETAALLVVSDELATLKWKAGFASRVFKASRKRTSEIVAEVCKELVLSI